MKITERELATILAALRKFQESPATDGEHFKDVRPLTANQIDELCERLNCSIVPAKGQHRNKKELLKIVIHIEGGIVQSVYANVPKADTQVFDTDPEFSELKKEKRNLKRAIKGLTEVR